MDRLNKLWPGNDWTLIVLGISPLLFVVTNIVIGFSIGMLCFITFILSAAAITLIKSLISVELRFFFIIVITSAVVISLDLLTQYWFFPLSEALGLYIYLIAVNCLFLAYIEEMALRNKLFHVMSDSVILGFTMLLIFTGLGFIREIAGQGTLFQQSDLIFGDLASTWTIQIVDANIIFIKAVPGAFFIFGLLLAGFNYLSSKADRSE